MTIYTLGYQGWKPDAITQTAARLDAVVVDVRLKPFSRYRPWTGPAFKARLGESYLWLHAFGNINYRLPIEQAKLVDYDAGKKVVAEILATGRPVILMCGCADLATCHRRIVAERLASDLGVQVEDLAPPNRHIMPRLF